MRNPEQRARHSQYMREYYKRHPEKRAAWKVWFRKYRKENKSFWIKFRKKDLDRLKVSRDEKTEFISRKKMCPCSDCGIQYNPWVMQFDHRNGKDKFLSIAFMQQVNVSMDILKIEIDKCDVVCANCHMERSHKRKSPNHYKGIPIEKLGIKTGY